MCQGLSAAGVVLYGPDGSLRGKLSKFLGEQLTNNEAEYMVTAPRACELCVHVCV